jgi:hypothetical protein
LQPLAARDLRLNARVNPKEGEVTVVQYGGGFISLADASDGNGTQVVIYAPALKSDGTVDKAHAMVFDPEASNQSVSLVHALGMALLMTADKDVIIKNAAGDAYLQVGDDGVTLNGNVTLNGGVVCGDTVAAQPVALAPPIVTWAASVNATLTAIAALLNAPGATLVASTNLAAREGAVTSACEELLQAQLGALAVEAVTRRRPPTPRSPGGVKRRNFAELPTWAPRTGHERRRALEPRPL